MSHDEDAAKAWEVARFDITELDKPEVAQAFGGELVNALRSTYIRGFRDGRAAPSETKLHELVPTNWLDPMLDGYRTKVTFGAPDIERLLRAIKARIQEAERG